MFQGAASTTLEPKANNSPRWNKLVPIRRKNDSTQVASCCETEESWNGRVRRISYVHKHTVTAGESKQSQGSQKREKLDQQDEKGPLTVTQGDQQH